MQQFSIWNAAIDALDAPKNAQPLRTIVGAESENLYLALNHMARNWKRKCIFGEVRVRWGFEMKI